MKKAIIIGAGTYGQVYAEYLTSEYRIIGYYDDDVTLKGKEFNSIPVLGSVEDAIEFISLNLEVAVFIPIGNNPVRYDLIKRFEAIDALLPSFIHNSVILHSSIELGKSVYVLPNCSVMPLTKIGDYTMISMGVNIAHHNTIGKACFFSQGVNVGASITIEDFAYCGISSTLMTGIKYVGKNSLIGAGAVVIKDVEDNTVVAGVPAKLIRRKDELL